LSGETSMSTETRPNNGMQRTRNGQLSYVELRWRAADAGRWAKK